jgi:hypothetical protein
MGLRCGEVTAQRAQLLANFIGRAVAATANLLFKVLINVAPDGYSKRVA